MDEPITTAMVLAAGFGVRMRPLTDTHPKPLVSLLGRPLLDHVLDRLEGAGVSRVVVNVHFLAEQIVHYAACRTHPRIKISHEPERPLDTGGGVARALPLLGDGPFYIHNSDSVWIEPHNTNLTRLRALFDPAHDDAVLLLAERATSLGYDGHGDFDLLADGRIRRPRPGEAVPYVFPGVSIADHRMFGGAPSGPFSINTLWDRSIAQGRVRALVMDGRWMHIGTPAALKEAEALMGQTGGQ